MKMKKITDERLILQNLKNIRVAFIIQSIGIVGILVYQVISDVLVNQDIASGIVAFTKNPLWMLLLLVGIVLNYQNLMIANDIEDKKTNPGPYYWILTSAVGIGVVIGLLVKFFPGDGNPNPLVAGILVSLCFLIPFTIVHFLLKKRLGNEDN